MLKWGNNTSYYNNPSLASFMGRVNYSYADKYIVTVNARTDGSSKVGANNNGLSSRQHLWLGCFLKKNL